MATFDVNDFEWDDENVTAATVQTLSAWEGVRFAQAALVKTAADAQTIEDLEAEIVLLEAEIEALENP